MSHRTFLRGGLCVCVALVFSVAAAAAPRQSSTATAATPQLTSLNGGWEVLPDAAGAYVVGALPANGWRAVRLPLSIQAQFADLRDFHGVAWYRRSVNLAAPPPGSHWLVRFGAVDYLAQLFVNGSSVGYHEGGYTPFSLDITAAAHPGNNSLLLRVADPPGDPANWQSEYEQIPHGKQKWYVQTTGIWQDVWLEQRPAYFITSAHALTEGNTLRGFRVAIANAQQVPAGAGARIEVFPPGATAPITRSAQLTAERESTLEFALSGQQLWTPEHPALYRFVIALPDGDRYSDRFGFRTITAQGGKLLLNGRPYYMIGALDQDFYPEGVYTPPSKDYIVREMRLAKSLGLNTLRCHIKIPDPRYLEAADETGMLIWYEIPNWDRLTAASRGRGAQTLAEMIERDWNHPSIIIQSIINESWGIDLTQADQRRWLAGMYAYAKGNLPDRLVDDNSACCENFHIASDLADFHQYYSIPDHVEKWDHWVRDFASRPSWLFSSYGDARPTGEEPLIVSEFGNWGLPQLPAQLPWWFTRDMNGNSLTLPAGVFERFREYGLDRIFHDYPTLARETERHEWTELRHEIESIRLEPTIQGYVITEFTDINWESNGLMSMWREPKAFARDIAALQQPIVVIATTDKPSYRAGETARVQLAISNYSAGPLDSTEITISRGARQVTRTPVPRVPSAAVVKAGEVEVPLTQSSTGIDDLTVALRAGTRVLDSRSLPIAVIAQRRAGARVQLAPEYQSERGPHEAARRRRESALGGRASAAAKTSPAAGDPALREQPSQAKAAVPPESLARRLQANGYSVGDHGVLITPRWDAQAQAEAEHGGTVIVLADEADALPGAGPLRPGAPSLRIVPRSGDLSGDWVSNFNWFDTTRAPFQALSALGPIAGPESRNVAPDFLIDGVQPSQYGDVLSGMFLGWIHATHALAVEARYGRGRVIIVTWKLAAPYGTDAYATAMLDALIDYATSGRAQPRLQF